MTKAHERKKEPEIVRQRLLSCGLQIIQEHGLNAVTMQAVSAAAGVTKGGMIHHFPDKQVFLEKLFDEMMVKLDADLERLMALNDGRQGTFSMAYAELCLIDAADGGSTAAHVLAMLGDVTLRQRWCSWLAMRVSQHAVTDAGPKWQLLRMAADGIWMAGLLGTVSPTDVQALRMELTGKYGL